MKLSTQDKLYHLTIAFLAHFLLLFMLSMTFATAYFVEPKPQQPEVLNIGTQLETPPAISNQSEIEIPQIAEMPAVETPEIPEIPFPSEIPNEILEGDSDKPPKDLTENGLGGELPGGGGPPPSKLANPSGGFKDGIVGPPEPVKPSFYGEPIHGKCLLVLDASGSMKDLGPNGLRRLDNLIIAAIGAIVGFTEEDEFDVIIFCNDQAYTIWGNLQNATEERKEYAIDWLKLNVFPIGNTPFLKALEVSCKLYPKDLEKYFLVSDGVPSDPTNMKSIITRFSQLWKFTNCEFTGICIGDEGLSFMKQLAKAVNGKVVTVE